MAKRDEVKDFLRPGVGEAQEKHRPASHDKDEASGRDESALEKARDAAAEVGHSVKKAFGG